MKIKIMFLILCSFGALVFAQNTEQDEVLTVPKSMLTADQLRQVKLRQNLNLVGEYTGLGQEIGTAINEGLGALTDHATSFSETDLGLYVMFLIGWKVVGTDFIQLLVGIPMLFFGSVFYIWVFFNTCRVRRFCVKVSGVGKDAVKEYDLHEPSGETRIVTTIWYLVYLVGCMVTIFAG